MRPLPRRLTVLALALAVTGCGSNAVESPTAKKLKGLATMYASFAVGKNGPGPKSEKEFKDYVMSAPFQQLPPGIDPDKRGELFVSDRDGQPFVIVPGASIAGMTADKAALVAYEQTGVGGKKLVAFANSKVEEVGPDRLQELVGSPK